MGSEAKFLEYNKDNIFISLVQAEGHFRNLESGFAGRGEFLSCVSKHLAYAEGEAEEAVSHSLVVEGSTRSQEYAKLRNDLRELRKKIQAGAVSPEEGIREVRKIRASFEKLNPPFDTSKCRSCGSSEEVLKKLRDLKDMESEMAESVLKDLSAKYSVKPPKLEISDSCHEPNEGYYKGGTIKLCQGGVNLHVLLHEFKHYYDHQMGKSLDEGDAEAFAVEIVEKGLYSPSAKHSYSESEMVSKTVKDTALIVGGVNIGWGIGYSAKAFIDPMAPGIIMGQDPSLLIDVGGTIAGIIGALRLRGDVAKKLSAYIAAGLSTHLWEDVTKLLAPAVAAGARMRVVGAPILGTGAVGETIPGIPAMPYPAARLAEYPFPPPVSVGSTMSPPHYTLNGVPGLKMVSLGPKYTLDTI